MHRVFASRGAAFLLASPPFLCLLVFIWKYSVEVPFIDHWDFVPLLEKSFEGKLTFGDVWIQHNEHRLLFPKLIMLGMAHLTSWNLNYELAMNILFAVGIFGLLVWQLFRTGRDLQMPELRWAVPVASLIVFSISQHENWLWGWQLQMFLNLLAVLASILLLSNPPFTWLKLGCAIVSAAIGTYSFANGLLVWPIGAVLLWRLAGAACARLRVVAVVSWCVAAALIIFAYFWHYQKPVEHPALSFGIDAPWRFLNYVFKYMGNMCAQFSDSAAFPDRVWAFAFGIAGSLLLGWASWKLSRGPNFTALLPYFAMCAYSIGSAMMTAIGRVGFGTNQSLHSRYCTMTIPLWFSLSVFLMILIARTRALLAGPIPATPKSTSDGPQRRARSDAPYRTFMIARWSLLVVVCLLILSSTLAIRGAQEWAANRTTAHDYLLSLGEKTETPINESILYRLYPAPRVVAARYPFLLKYRLALYRSRSAAPPP